MSSDAKSLSDLRRLRVVNQATTQSRTEAAEINANVMDSVAIAIRLLAQFPYSFHYRPESQLVIISVLNNFRRIAGFMTGCIKTSHRMRKISVEIAPLGSEHLG